MAAERIQISSHDQVNIGEVFQGLIDDEVELADLPDSFNADGKAFPITTDTLVSGLRLQLREKKNELRHAISHAEIDGALYRGVEVKATESRDEVVFRLSKGQEIRIYPSTFTPEQFGGLLESATPTSIEDFDMYARDILKHFARDLIVSHDYNYNGWSGTQYSEVTEERSAHATKLVDKLTLLRVDQRRILGDDFSKNLAMRNIATQLFEEMTSSPNPEAYATQFASTWLELRFQQEIALRTRTDREFQRTDFAENTYEPGSQKGVPKYMTVLRPSQSL
jgi:hypothetical protein